jgi:cytochrome c oxidase subunit I+III
MIILMFVAGALFLAYLFSYLYVWTVSPDVWPSADAVPDPGWGAGSLAAFAGAVGCFWLATRRLASVGRAALVPWLVLAGASAAAAGVGIELLGHWQSGLRPSESSYAALVYMEAVLNGELVVAVLIMSGFTAARYWCGKLDSVRNACLENTALLLYYTAGQAALGLAVVHGFPRLL